MLFLIVYLVIKKTASQKTVWVWKYQTALRLSELLYRQRKQEKLFQWQEQYKMIWVTLAKKYLLPVVKHVKNSHGISRQRFRSSGVIKNLVPQNLPTLSFNSAVFHKAVILTI